MNLEPEINKESESESEVDLNESSNNPGESFSGKTVLIVDDDPFLLEMYAKKFKNFNFEIATAFNGEEAIQTIKDGLNPDILLFDLIMPQMDGIEMIRKINEEKLVTSSVKVVLSNQGQQEDVAELEKIGIDGYIIKAMFTPSEVVTEVLKIYKNKN